MGNVKPLRHSSAKLKYQVISVINKARTRTPREGWTLTLVLVFLDSVNIHKVTVIVRLAFEVIVFVLKL